MLEGGLVDFLERQAGEGGVEAGQQGSADVAFALIDRLMDLGGEAVDFFFSQFDGGAGVVGGIVLLHLHVEVELGQGGELLNSDAVCAGQVGPGHFHGNFHEPFGDAVVEGVVEQVAVFVFVGLGGHDGVAVVEAGPGNGVVFAEGDATDESLGFGWVLLNIGMQW